MGIAGVSIASPRSGLKQLGARFDVNLLGAGEDVVLVVPREMFFHHALVIARDVSGLAVAPQVSIWSDDEALTATVALAAMNANGEAVYVPAASTAIPVLSQGAVITLQRSATGDADSFVCDVYIFGVETGGAR